MDTTAVAGPLWSRIVNDAGYTARACFIRRVALSVGALSTTASLSGT
ncbi:MAG: hypothetical protein JWO79_1408, partial [Actinomycetia bacterium]|nr:hypothetical protein [Actinomycetes bacterium]